MRVCVFFLHFFLILNLKATEDNDIITIKLYKFFYLFFFYKHIIFNANYKALMHFILILLTLETTLIAFYRMQQMQVSKAAKTLILPGNVKLKPWGCSGYCHRSIHQISHNSLIAIWKTVCTCGYVKENIVSAN